MNSLDVQHSRAILTDLMNPRSGQVGVWTPEDLAGVLEHQLRTSLEVEVDDLARSADLPTEEVRSLLRASGFATFGDVLRRGTPDDGVLAMVKAYAKRAMASDDGLPRPVAHFIYVSTLLRARVEGDASFTALNDAAVDSEARRCLTLHWLPDEARALLRAGLER